MRYLTMYFSSRVIEGVTTYIYTTKKALKATLKVNGTAQTFSLSYRDGKPKENSSVDNNGSYTLWLNDFDENGKRVPKLREEAMLYREVYGDECMFEIDADGNGKLIPMEEFNSLPKESQNIVTAAQLHV